MPRGFGPEWPAYRLARVQAGGVKRVQPTNAPKVLAGARAVSVSSCRKRGRVPSSAPRQRDLCSTCHSRSLVESPGSFSCF